MRRSVGKHPARPSYARSVLRRSVSILGLTAAGSTLAVAVAYALVLHSEGEGDLGRGIPRFIIASLAVFAAAAAVGASARDTRVRTALLASSAAGVLAYAAVAAFSIGGLLAIAGFVTAAAAARESLGVDGRLAAVTLPAIVVGAFGVFWLWLALG
jgi:hypothetical protein